MNQKLFHISLGKHNPDLWAGLDSVFHCSHFDWTTYMQSEYPKLQTDLREKFKAFNPDIVFIHCQQDGVVQIETVKEMMKSAIVVNWTGDVRKPIPSFYYNLGAHIDLTLFTNETDVEEIRKMNIKSDFLQVGFDINHFNPIYGRGRVEEKYPEIIFLGSNYPDAGFPLTTLRWNMVQRLRQEFGSRFEVYGGGWGNHNVISNYEKEGAAYRSCKIAINCSHFNYSRYSSDRMYRILGSGAFCLSHNYENIAVDFQIGKDLDVWNNLDELVLKIKYYLEHNEERERIALQGCLNARTNFTWHHFAKNLKLITDKLKKEKYVTVG